MASKEALVLAGVVGGGALLAFAFSKKAQAGGTDPTATGPDAGTAGPGGSYAGGDLPAGAYSFNDPNAGASGAAGAGGQPGGNGTPGSPGSPTNVNFPPDVANGIRQDNQRALDQQTAAAQGAADAERFGAALGTAAVVGLTFGATVAPRIYGAIVGARGAANAGSSIESVASRAGASALEEEAGAIRVAAPAAEEAVGGFAADEAAATSVAGGATVAAVAAGAALGEAGVYALQRTGALNAVGQAGNAIGNQLGSARQPVGDALTGVTAPLQYIGAVATGLVGNGSVGGNVASVNQAIGRDLNAIGQGASAAGHAVVSGVNAGVQVAAQSAQAVAGAVGNAGGAVANVAVQGYHNVTSFFSGWHW